MHTAACKCSLASSIFSVYLRSNDPSCRCVLSCIEGGGFRLNTEKMNEWISVPSILPTQHKFFIYICFIIIIKKKEWNIEQIEFTYNKIHDAKYIIIWLMVKVILVGLVSLSEYRPQIVAFIDQTTLSIPRTTLTKHATWTQHNIWYLISSIQSICIVSCNSMLKS